MKLVDLRATLATTLLTGMLLSGCTDDPTDQPENAQNIPSDSPSLSATDTLIETGLSQINAGELDAAEGTFASVLALEPSNVYALYNLGYISQVNEDVPTAVQQYNAAIEVDPEFAPALYNLALLTESADLQAATDLYRRVLAVTPDDAATHMRLGFALQELGQTDEGQELLDRGIELDPSMADVRSPRYE